mmetsp:Transcript_36334/g.48711  ORF Transcript_36334/g.48711 Transcript_36334/m.48711 type:complete len:263 (-) Transcript_36334:296-1084(-)
MTPYPCAFAIVSMTIVTVSSFNTLGLGVSSPLLPKMINGGAFIVPHNRYQKPMTTTERAVFSPWKKTSSALHASSSSDDDKKDNDVSSMKAGDIRKELESYGINTKSFLEKSELVEALEKARAEGKKPVDKTSTSSSSSSSSTSSSTSSSSSSSASSLSREEKIKLELEKCKSMKVGELKKELESLGISTKTFFEKSEFVKALAEARVDDVKKSTSRKASSAGTPPPQQEEEYDPSYRDVAVSKFQYDPYNMAGPLIDIRLN